MPTIYFPVSYNCWDHNQPQPAGLLQDACDPGRDFRPRGNTKILLTQQNKHSLKCWDHVCTCPVEQAGVRQKRKSSHELHQFSTSSQSVSMSLKYQFLLTLGRALQRPPAFSLPCFLFQDINECILENYPECSNPRLFYIIPYFCGQHPRCR